MATTKQVVQAAIDSSIREDRIARIRLSDLQDGDTLADAQEVLDAREDREGDVRANGEHEYWGTSGAGEWRVHVVL